MPSRVKTLMLALLGPVSGVGVALVLAVLTGLDVRLVNAYRGSRTVPYRLVFFALVFLACAVASLRGARRAGAVSAVRVGVQGAGLGYLSGFLSWWILQIAWTSWDGALVSLRDFPTGFVGPLAVPVLTLSWGFGLVAFLISHMTRRAVRLAAG